MTQKYIGIQFLTILMEDFKEITAIKWQELINKYILFFNGDSRVLLNSMNFSRVHFAFLDGCHTYDDVIYEFSSISDHQLPGDVIVFDDYTLNTYDGVVKAVDEIAKYS